ncbi:MAG: sel1 repeat family protein [Gammaproteobacteria bacterium]|nr:sel1 repeat family protein [Gammaproteobacteria bacterium]
MRYSWLILLVLLVGCASRPSERAIINMPVSDVLPLAEEGDSNAMHALCYRYLYGEDGAQKNYETAFKWCEKSALTGQSSSLTLLAEMYYLGQYVKRDYDKAFTYYKKAAGKDHNHAQFMLFVMYNSGQSVEKDIKKAEYWIKRAARNGNPQAQKILRN